jgi:cytochrome c oxidase cbb3-type subunit III
VAAPTRSLIPLVAVVAACGGARDNDAQPAAARDAGAVAPPLTDAGRGGGDGARIARGAGHYSRLCAQCHGPDARGYAADNAPSLVTETFLASADDDFIARSIALGRPGTSMAGYAKHLGGPLSGVEIAEIVAFLRSRGPEIEPVVLAPVGPGEAARGEALYAQACAACHGDPTVRRTAVHLANPTFLDLASDELLRHAIVHGRPGTQMEAFGTRLEPQQIDDLVALLRSWAPPPGSSQHARPPTDASTPALPVVINPDGKPANLTARDGRFVKVDDVKRALDAGRRIVIVDARPQSDWSRTRIAGAISVPYHQLDAIATIPNDGTWVIAYCACPHHLSGLVVDELKKRGYKNAGVLDEGVLVWQERGYPLDGTGPHADPKLDPHAGHSHGH